MSTRRTLLGLLAVLAAACGQGTVVQPPALAVSTATLAFTGAEGGAAPAAQLVTVSNTGGGTLAVPLATTSYGSGSGWLGVTLGGTQAPYTLSIQPSLAGLAAGSYSATVTITASGALGSPRTVAVSLTVSAAPRLALSSTSLAFTGVAGGGAPPAQVVTVTNGGSGSLAVPAASVSYGAGAGTGWLGVTVGGTQPPYAVTVRPNLSALATGSYSATVTLSAAGAGAPRTIAVSLTVTAAPRLALSATSLAFTGTEGGAAPAAQAITASNTGGSGLPAPTVAVVYGSGAGWLTVAVSGAQAPYTLSVRPALPGLVAGSYSATVRVSAVDALDSPQDVAVTLTLAPPPPPAMIVSAGAVEFRAASSAPADQPASQVVTVSGDSATPLARPSAAVSYGAGGSGWLTATVTGAAAPYTLTLQASAAALTDGIFSATVTLASANATNSPLSIPVKLWIGRVVEVRRLLTWWREDGTTEDLPDDALSTVAVLHDDGAGGLFRIQAQPGVGAGRWLALAAPGAYWAELTFADGRRSYLAASADLLDAGEDLGGRPDVALAAAATPATLTLDGLIGWLPGSDVLRLSSFDAQASAELAPASDPVSTPVDFDWAATLQALLVPSDVLRVGHYTLRFPNQAGGATGRFEYLAALAATSESGVTVVSGAPLDLIPPVATGATAATLAIDWRMAAMEAASSDPSGAPGLAHRLGLYAIPARLTSASPLGAVPVTVLEALQPAGGGDLAEPVVPIGRVSLGAAWREYQEVSFAVPVNRRAAGAVTPLLGASNQVLARAESASPLLAQPLVGSPVEPLLDGSDALAVGRVTSTTPLLAWSAPTAPAAAPSSYRVVLWRLTASGGATAGQLVADFVVAGTSLRVPGGLLVAGGAYAASIAARTSPGDAGGVTPYRVGVPFGEANLWTQVFTAQ